MASNIEASKKERVRQWALEVSDFEESGLSVKDFCKTRGIALSTFGRHKALVRNEALLLAAEKNLKESRIAQPIRFAKVELNGNEVTRGDSERAISLETTKGTITVHSAASPEQIRTVLEVLFRA